MYAWYESYKIVVQGLARLVQGNLAFFREKYCISASNRKDNIFFKAKSSLFGSYILKKSAGNTLDKISYNYRYIKLVLIYKKSFIAKINL